MYSSGYAPILTKKRKNKDIYNLKISTLIILVRAFESMNEPSDCLHLVARFIIFYINAFAIPRINRKVLRADTIYIIKLFLAVSRDKYHKK